MSLGGTSPSSFLFLLGRAHAISKVVGASFVPAVFRDNAGNERVLLGL